jgi:hypothetical protein
MYKLRFMRWNKRSLYTERLNKWHLDKNYRSEGMKAIPSTISRWSERGRTSRIDLGRLKNLPALVQHSSIEQGFFDVSSKLTVAQDEYTVTKNSDCYCYGIAHIYSATVLLRGLYSRIGKKLYSADNFQKYVRIVESQDQLAEHMSETHRVLMNNFNVRSLWLK